MNDISSACLCWKLQSRDAQRRGTAKFIFWMFYNDCSPLSQKVNLTHLRLLIDKFLFLLSTSTGMLTMRHTGNFITSMLSLLSSSLGGVTKGTGRAQQEPTLSAWEGKWWLSGLVLRERREILLLGHVLEEGMTATAGSGVSKMMKAKFTGDGTAAQATAYRGQFTTHSSGAGGSFRLWFNQTHLNHPQCSFNNDNFSLCLFPETFKTVSVRICKYDPSRQWTVLNWNTLIKSPLTI